MNAVSVCSFGPSFFSPKRNRPRNVDSRKNANVPSIASVWPITPPAARENSDQLVPNWNSRGIPVTTPMTKFTAKIFVQNRAPRPYSSLPERRAMTFKTKMRRASPIVSCGKR